MKRHQILVKDKDKTIIGEISDWFNLAFSDQINNYGQATFQIPIDSNDAVKLIAPRRYEIEILEDGVSVWSGEQADAEATIIADSPNFITITNYTYLEMLNARETPEYVRYEQLDQALILKALMDYTQSKTDGDFGFTFPDTIVPTKKRDREYKLDNIMEAYINMTNVIDGIDVWIDKDKVVRFGEPRRGVDKSNQYTFEWKVNMSEFKIKDNFTTPANTVYVIGSNDGVKPLIIPFADPVTRKIYKLREQTTSAIDVTDEDTLLGKAKDLVNTNKNARRTIRSTQIPNTSPSLANIGIGDSVKVIFKKGRYDINAPYRILGYENKIGQVGESNISWILQENLPL